MKEADIFANLPSLETDRLILRRLRRDDDEAVYAYGSDPEVSRYVIWEQHRSIQDSRAFIEAMLECYLDGQVAPWAFEEKRSGRLIGTGGYVNWHIEHARAEIGYSLARTFWNQGFTTEATEAMITFGFRVMALNRIEAQCDVRNRASARVMEKVGMTYEGTLRERIIAHGTFCDVKFYSILLREWESRML